MKVIELVSEMRAECDRAQASGLEVRLVPTMGALHAGHGSLIELAKQTRSKSSTEATDANVVVVVVSIFVNRKQFNQASDYDSYPNTLAQDLEYCRRLGVDYAFVPSVAEMYPDDTVEQSNDIDDFSCRVVAAPALADQLEGRTRRNHFTGVLTVVSKLFNITRPRAAYFGEKDYQQLVLVRRMVRDLNMDVSIVGARTVRDPTDGLPLSSRNVRLGESERRVAPVMCEILVQAKEALELATARNNNSELVSKQMQCCEHNQKRCTQLDVKLMASMLSTTCLCLSIDDSRLLDMDYLELRCARDLSELSHINGDFWDCERGCVRQRIGARSQQHQVCANATCSPRTVYELKARLLTSVVVGGVRLLDNIEVVLNK